MVKPPRKRASSPCIMATLSSAAPPPPRQIRFVNNQGQPPSKRRRVNAACLTCRKRKTRCDGEKPTCSTCDKNGHQCLGYPEHPEKTKYDRANISVKLEGRAESEISAEPNDELMQDGVDDNNNNDHHRRHWKSPNENSERDQSAAKASASHKPRSQSTSTSSVATSTRPRKESTGWERDSSQSQTPGRSAKRPSCTRTMSFSEDSRSASNRSPIQRHHESHKVPYFRYFGPTAIVPGFKQMVVNIPRYARRPSRGGSVSATSPASMLSHHSAPSHADTVLEAAEDLPVYDPNDPAPVHPIIMSLIKTFFTHLGCSYPFLREEKMLRLVREKRVESILVDAMCALAARFSNIEALAASGDGSRSEYGNTFARRAKAATVDTFPCPTVGAVRACLLMAYEGFGANQDSALWMYLGLAIRMAFDLGLQKNEGVQYQGDKDPWYIRSWNRTGNEEDDADVPMADGETLNPKEQQEIVQERIDTAWAVYILDRVISAGTGRTVTVRDEEFELPTPGPRIDPASGLPAPYPAFIQIIQFYGRVSDVLNKLKRVQDLTDEKMATLAKIEVDLTKLYQRQDPQLHFNPSHFQNYVKNGQGTTFILLHVWFHALIIILHQPLLTPFGIREPQLVSQSRELAMSSAKTIADILALAELIDPKSYIGSPFTSQPMYIAACAFLTESAANASQPASRDTSPPAGKRHANITSSNAADGRSNSAADAKPSKHSLLAEAANQNYQRCYKSLQQLNMYWGGVNYILVALDHRSKGIWDCETYTAEEYESTRLPRRPGSLARFPHLDNPASPQPSMPPIAWSLTGTTNSPNSSLTFLYQNMNTGQDQSNHALPPLPPPHTTVSAPTPPGNMIYDPIRQSLPESTNTYSHTFHQPHVTDMRYSTNSSNHNRMASLSSNQAPGPRSVLKYNTQPSGEVGPLPGVASGNHVLPPSVTQPYTPSSSYESSVLQGGSPSSSLKDPINPSQQQRTNHHINGGPADLVSNYGHDFAQNGLASGAYSYLGIGAPIADAITVEEINIGSLGLPGDIMPPWDFFPGDFTGLFDLNNLGDAGSQAHM